jgi:hypothetical protein
MHDTSRNWQEAQDHRDRYTREVERVSEYLRQRMVWGRDIRGLIHDAACQFPGLSLGVFHDALMEVYARAGSDAFPTRRPQ